MFTGIIQEVGKIKKIESKEDRKIFTILSKEIIREKKIGDSISHNGACLTIIDIKQGQYKCEAINETLKLTNLGDLQENSDINLEAAVKFGQSLDGHLVQGHVDCLGIVRGWQKNNLQIDYPKEIQQYLAYKGSITINGVSLTISRLQDQYFEVSLIAHTLENTNLGKLKKNDKVNLEIDIIARYLESLLNNKNKEAKYEFLKERGFI